MADDDFFEVPNLVVDEESSSDSDASQEPEVKKARGKALKPYTHSKRECEEQKRLYFRITGSNKYIFASSTSQITEKAELKEAYDKIFVNGALSWPGRCPELFYECSCRQGSKKEVCRHATMVMCNIDKIVAYSAEATAAPMKGNRRKKNSVGRVPLAPRQHHHAFSD